MSTFHDIIWPPDDDQPEYIREYVKDRCKVRRAQREAEPPAQLQLQREIEESWCDARRIAAKRRRENRRTLLVWLPLSLLFLAATIAVIWVLSGQALPPL